MKKKVSLLLAMAILASAMSVAACSNNKTSQSSQTVSSEAVITVPADTTAAEKDAWNVKADPRTALGAAQIADSVLGKEIDETIGGDHFKPFMGNSTAFNHDGAGSVVIPEAGFEIEGIPFKKIYLRKEGETIHKVTFSIRDKEFLPMTQSEAKSSASDLKKDAGTAADKIMDSLKNALGECKTEDAGLTGASKSGRYVWEKNGTVIAVTYGIDCYGIEGNNEFKIDVYHSDKTSFGLSRSDSEFREKVYRMYGCFGQDYETAKGICEDVLGVPLTKEQKDKSDYYYHVELDLEGAKFNQLILRTNPSGKVFDVYLVNDMDKEDTSKGYYDLLYAKLETLFGPYFIPTNSMEYEGVINGPRDGCWCILGSKTINGHTRFYFIFNNEGLRNG